MNRSPLKWPGGKSRVMAQLLPYLSKADCLIEPFIGGASVFMNTDYRRYVLADINPHLINFYQTIVADTEGFLETAYKALFRDSNNAEKFYSMREMFNQCKAPGWAQAARFLYLNRHGYNGMIRYNQKGELNVPFGHYKRVYFPAKEIRLFAEKARDTKAIFLCADFRTTLLTYAAPDTAIYCDPPYLPASATANFTSYYASAFGLVQHQNLVKTLLELNRKHGALATFSGSDTAETRKVYAPFRLHEINVQRSVSAKSRGKADELIGTLKVCEGCGCAGGGMCPDCGPCCGDTTYAAMEESGVFEDTSCACTGTDACKDCMPFGYGWQTPWPELPGAGHE
ncbi:MULTISPECIES: Dam family site-specific DNA-(adenine-N6)-methyltransferase [unclassified Pantoea]|uniref:DNA adenine methylase n=1 Tax=unclassified Pantoea TaxID=2630326 RepID=UPI001232E3BA|nr:MULTISPECIES: Dam family site-specific DNA-(adenine-N6)-methyltransferase [unclassified Pantoea]KAA5952037.1 Dam family site-specific DNA-(adenine-N6)-methyltransferase [Pantoea sp. VH_24]KAA5953433.1 Dam family site-specific DNA-(adenine-N6)-methyltransferase [Pantoea sp. VH_16]KAA5961625.1 Dam family site-specific DNA-(adenine-N6)-methyltransferase [Pantoea sp. VH_18]KAA5993333.1 Dam family site-specific DNA-(adenine-N6)-methyltransferase [Pantoea sp. M_1]KAA5998097.1 Dam family site-spec